MIREKRGEHASRDHDNMGHTTRPNNMSSYTIIIYSLHQEHFNYMTTLFYPCAAI